MLAKGGFERVTDYEAAIDQALVDLRESGHLQSDSDVDAVGFKTVLGKNLSGCVEAGQRVLDALEGFREVAPAHNPAYAAGIRAFEKRLPSARRVALFETAFYQWTAPGWQHYAVPQSWYQAGVSRKGFHGASHKYIAERSAEVLGRADVAQSVRGLYVSGPQKIDGKPLRVVSCHLGGSSSLTGLKNGVAIGCSFGMSPQSGLPHNNRVGDLDSMAVPFVMKTLGLSLEEVERQMAKEGGLLGLSGVSNDMREVVAAASSGNERARLALDVFCQSIRHYIGAFLLELGGLDGLVFTGGIGENQSPVREQVCAGLEAFGLKLDTAKNAAPGEGEVDLSAAGSTGRILIIPTNEELVVARETFRLLQKNPAPARA